VRDLSAKPVSDTPALRPVQPFVRNGDLNEA